MNGQIRILEVFLSGRQEVANLIDTDKKDASIKAFFFTFLPSGWQTVTTANIQRNEYLQHYFIILIMGCHANKICTYSENMNVNTQGKKTLN